MIDGKWFDPEAMRKYGSDALRGFRTNINNILGYTADKFDAYRLGKIFERPETQIDMNRKAMDIATENARRQQAEYLQQEAQRQAQEDIAQAGRGRAVGSKEAVGPKTTRINVSKNLPNVVKETPKTGLLGKAGRLVGKATPWLVGGLGALETVSNWNEPGSDLVSRAMDATAPIVGVGAPLLGARFGTPGLVAGSALGILGGINNAKQAEIRRQANAPYDTSYLNNPEAIRQLVEDNLRREAKSLGMSDEEANAWVAKYLKDDLEKYGYAQQYGRKKPIVEKLNGAEGQEQFQFPFMDKNNYLLGTPVGSLPELPSVDAQSSQNGQEGGVNTPQDINSLVQALTLLKGATDSSNNYIPTPNETLSTLLQFSGYPQYGQQLMVQQPQDDGDFYQRVYDKVDDIRSLEGIEQDAQNRPELRPKAEIEQSKAEVEQPKTSDDIMLDKLNQLNELIRPKDSSDGWDAIRRAHFARSVGMTPYRIWGGYPNQSSALNNAYRAFEAEYKIRKDIEDRDRIKKAGEALSQKFVDDPMLQYAIASGVDADKIAEMLGVPEANKFPYEMAKKDYDRTTDLFKNYQTGMNTLSNTALLQSMITGRIYPDTIADLILKEYDKTTPSQKDINDYNFKTNKFNSEMAYKTDKANLDTKVRLATKNGGINSPKMNDYINTAKFYADNGDLDTARSIMEIVINNLGIDAEDIDSDLDYNFRGVE